MTKRILAAVGLTAAFLAGFAVRGVVPGEPVAFAQGNRVFELRTYTVADGKLDALHKRFRDETVPKFFPRHGMANVWYGKPMDAPLAQNSMTYMIAFPSREAAKKSWDSFRADPEWTKVAAASGVGQVKIESVYFEPADYSPLK
jgi:NIPSNAP.